jgi:hypothetical protein
MIAPSTTSKITIASTNNQPAIAPSTTSKITITSTKNQTTIAPSTQNHDRLHQKIKQ